MLMGRHWCWQGPCPLRPGEGAPCAAPLPGLHTLVASRSVTCFMVRGLYPLCRS